MFTKLEYVDWKNACKLLKAQIEATNKHFLKFSILDYKQHFNEVFENKIISKDYFETNIRSGLILLDEERIFTNYYPEPKGILKYRRWMYLSLELRLL
jgi:hypothetical protein